MIQVRLLRAPRVERIHPGGRVEVLLRGGKALALLAYLALAAGRTHRRATLADLLWGDESPDHARGSLRQALSTLRRVLGGDVVATDNESVTLSAATGMVDVLDFLAASRRGDFEGMLASYGGPLCDGLDLRGAHAFVQWLDGERERLRRLLVSRAVEVIPARLEGGDAEGALAWARQLHAALPEESDSACLLFDTLVASDQGREALEVIEGVRAAEVRAGMPASAEVARRLQRATAARRPLAPSSALRRGWNARMVGREQQLAALADAVESTRTDGPLHLAVVGAAGMGKTRLLDECESRWRLRGLRAVRVRFVQGMREIPFAGLSELVRGMCAVPGALGVDPLSASVLIGLVPELQAEYPGVLPTHGASVVALTHALEDLYSAVAERRAVILIMDDLHHADEGTRRVLSGARVTTGTPLLVIYGARPGAAPQSDRVIGVSSLEATDIRTLFEGTAMLPATAWANELPRTLRESTGGVPQLVDQVIRELVEQRLVTHADGQWQCADPDTMLASAAHPRVLEESIAKRSPGERTVLRVLGRWRRELREDALLPALRRLDSGPPDAEWREAITALEAAGLLLARDASWQVSHDTVGDAVSRLETPSEREDVLRALIGAWRMMSAASFRDVEHAARLCGELDFLEGAELLAATASSRPEWRSRGRSGRELADRLARAAGREEWARPLYRSMRFLARQSRRSLLGIGAATAAVLLAMAWGAWMLQPRLVVEVPPMGERVDLGAAILVVQPRVAVRDGFGRSLRWVRGAVRARSLYGPVAGDSIVPLRAGRAQFVTLALAPVRDTSWYREDIAALEFRGPWYVRSSRISVPGAWLGAMPDAFRVTAATINGVALQPNLTARVRRGEPLLIDVAFEYSTSRPTANYVVGASATWTPRDSVLRLTGLPSPVRDGWQSVTFRLPPPDAREPSYIVLLAGAEDRVENIFSATGWTLERPVWGDGNDVADLDVESIERLRRSGMIELSYLAQDYLGPQGDMRIGDSVFVRRRMTQHVLPRPFSGTAIRIIVDE